MQRIIYKMVDGIPSEVTYSRKEVEGFESIILDDKIRKIEDVDWESIKTEAAKEREAAKSTQSICIQYLNESEIHVSQDPPYPEDTQKWKDSRVAWRTILKSGKSQEVPEKPF